MVSFTLSRHMLTVQPFSLGSADEKLGTVGPEIDMNKMPGAAYGVAVYAFVVGKVPTEMGSPSKKH